MPDMLANHGNAVALGTAMMARKKRPENMLDDVVIGARLDEISMFSEANRCCDP